MRNNSLIILKTFCMLIIVYMRASRKKTNAIPFDQTIISVAFITGKWDSGFTTTLTTFFSNVLVYKIDLLI